LIMTGREDDGRKKSEPNEHLEKGGERGSLQIKGKTNFAHKSERDLRMGGEFEKRKRNCDRGKVREGRVKMGQTTKRKEISKKKWARNQKT